jgi:hypothetical protein
MIAMIITEAEKILMRIHSPTKTRTKGCSWSIQLRKEEKENSRCEPRGHRLCLSMIPTPPHTTFWAISNKSTFQPVFHLSDNMAVGKFAYSKVIESAGKPVAISIELHIFPFLLRNPAIIRLTTN